MPLIVEDLTGDEALELDAVDKIRRAEQLLGDAAPVHARWVARFLDRVFIADVRRLPVRNARGKNAVLGIKIVRRGSPGDLSLILIYLAVVSRLRRTVRRFESADRRAQYWRRVRREVLTGARSIDRWEDPEGYVSGVSVGRWEPWADRWLGRTVRAPTPLGRALRDHYRDLRSLGVPRLIARAMLAYRKWRWRDL
jgi:hypothetical protein